MDASNSTTSPPSTHTETTIPWTLLNVIVLAFAAITTLLTLFISLRKLNVQESAVQYITYSLCRSYFVYSFSRLVFYLSVLCNWMGLHDLVKLTTDGEALGVRSIHKHGVPDSHAKLYAGMVVAFGDAALLCTTFWVMTMSYELTRLISKSMDRGKDRERRVVRIYRLRTYGISMLFMALMMLSVVLSVSETSPTTKEDNDYKTSSHMWTASDVLRRLCLVFQNICVWVSFVYPLYCAARISVRKRVPRRVVDPASLLLHQRMKNLVRVYSVLVFPVCVIETIAFILGAGKEEKTVVPVELIAAGQFMYYFSGGASMLVIGTSLTCIYRILRPFMPEAVYEHLLENGYFSDHGSAKDWSMEPPLSRPIFVNTDIEGSTLLWAKEPDAMSTAQSLHDDLLRRELIKFNGYEIATCGDAFQLAFHRVQDAIGWCLSVQQSLLKVQWPSALHAYDSAARVYDIWGRLIFNGLRVRMGIHNGDTQLVCSKHPTTGKMTYLGISELVAREMSDMGNGGQILISETALHQYEQDEAPSDHKGRGTFFYRKFDVFERPELDTSMQLLEIMSTALGDRYRKEKETRTELANARLVLLRHH